MVPLEGRQALRTGGLAGRERRPFHSLLVRRANASPEGGGAFDSHGVLRSQIDGAGVPELILTEAQNGARLKVRVGDTVMVSLSESAGTGYRWMVVSLDQAYVRIAEQSYQSTSTAIGGSGVAVWRLTTTRPGRTRVELKKARPWESGEAKSQHFAIDLEVAE
jgi:inhibitor of cysteine peptidase